MSAVKSEPTDSRPNGPAAWDDAAPSRWFVFRWLWPERSVLDDDEKVRLWRTAWVSGAEARWAGASPTGNPHPSASPQAAAWHAGWQWGDQQPDRRQQVRFAHPRRRSTDKPSVLRRGARAGAVGLSVLAVVGWFWRRRQRSE